MKSSIYITVGKIQIIGYKKNGRGIKIKEYLSAALPEGVMINGKITDPAELIEILRQLKLKNPGLFKKASLVIDSTSLIVKKIAVPYLKKKQYYQLVKEELSGSSENTENLIFDYSFMNSKKAEQTAILACGTDKPILESYLNVFSEVGINLTSMWVGLQAIINFVKQKKELTNQTFILNIIDGVSMLSVIFEKGSYIFSTRTRLLGDTEDQYLANILENLSPLIQFNKSQNFEDITASYYLGLDEKQVKYIDSINAFQNIDISLMDIYGNAKGSEKIGELCHFALLGTANDKKSIDLITSFKNADKQNVERKQVSPWTVTGIVFAVLLIGVFIFPVASTALLNKKVKEMRAFLDDPTVVIKAQEIAKTVATTARYTEIIKQRDEKKAEIDAKTGVDSILLDTIRDAYPEKVTVSNIFFEENQGVVHVTGLSATENDSSDYVERLKKNKLIDDVSYTGYSYLVGVAGEANARNFNFFIDIALKSKANGGAGE